MGIDIPALINELNQTDEHHQIEAKAGREISRPVLQSICAFSNEPGLSGGVVLLGLSRDEGAMPPRYEVTGVTDPDKLSQDVASQCASIFNVPVRPRVQTEMIQGVPVVAIRVQEATEKPVYFKSRGLPEGAYRRIGSTDQGCTESDLLVFFQSRGGKAFDQSLVDGARLADFDDEAITDYRKLRKDVNPEAAELSWSDAELLEALGAMQVKGGEPRPTVAGVLLFGKTRAHRRLFPGVRLDYLRVPGTTWVEDPDQRYVANVEFRGPLFQVVRRAVSTIIDDLPKGFNLPEGSLQSEDTLPLPRRVIREAVVNAVMHRDYKTHRPTQIIRYANRIEVTNAGFSLKAEQKLGETGSELRNPTIAAVFHETNFAETKGSGIRVMRRFMEQAGLAPPTFDSDREGNTFTARLLLHHFLGEEDLAWLQALGAPTPEQMKALVFLREVGAVDNSTYRQLSGVGTLKASQDLRALRDEGLLEMKGQGRSTYYVPSDKLVQSMRKHAQGATRGSTTAVEPARATEETSIGSEKSSTGSAESSIDKGLSKEVSSVGSEESSVGSAESSIDRGAATEKTSDVPALPPHLESKVAQIGRRAQPDEVMRCIEALCNWRALRAEELATFLDRNLSYLVSRYLSPMIREGTLEYTIPEMPNHPKQRYQTPGGN